jgi:hypothetical protein
MPDDEDDLFDVGQGRKHVEHMPEDGLARNIDEGFRLGKRVGAEPFAKPSERDDDFHVGEVS